MADFEDRAGLTSTRAKTLAAVAARQHMLHEVVSWMGALSPTPELVTVIDQDEFTNDVVLRLEDCWLSYDST